MVSIVGHPNKVQNHTSERKLMMMMMIMGDNDDGGGFECICDLNIFVVQNGVDS